jgi:uncharacterized protein (TIGR00299 family) protein
MGTVLYVDVVGGAAGDMLLAALVDAGAPLDVVREAVAAVLPGRVDLDTEEVQRGGLRAKHLLVRWQGPAGDGPESGRSFAELRAAVDRAPLADPVRRISLGVLDRLAEAEGRVHGVPAEQVSFHELGDDDTLVDVVGVCAALDAMAVTRVFVSGLPLGTGGLIESVHGPLPIPAPVTLELLRGFAVRGEGGEEWVTPTAAALLATVGSPSGSFPSMVVRATGYGAGTMDPEGYPNVVRVVAGDEAPTTAFAGEGGPVERELAVLEANLDDLSPQLVADAAEALLAEGALDVWTTPAHMKKGRSGVVLSALCEPELEGRLRQVFFLATTTLGVRSTAVRRTELRRKFVTVDVEGHPVRVKLGLIGDRVVQAMPEHDDVAALAPVLGRPVRQIHQEAAAAALGRGRTTADEGPA